MPMGELDPKGLSIRTLSPRAECCPQSFCFGQAQAAECSALLASREVQTNCFRCVQTWLEKTACFEGSRVLHRLSALLEAGAGAQAHVNL